MRVRKPSIGRGKRLLALEPLESRCLLATGPVITELMASNRDTLRDEDGDSVDWIEIHNPTLKALDLQGWSLTDSADNLTRWKFPALTIEPGQYTMVYASGKDRTAPNSELHTNFKLDKDGEFLAIVAADGTTIEHQYAPEFPAQSTDISYGLSSDLTTSLYFTDSTPGAENGDGFFGIVSTPTVNVERGIFSEPFEVAISSASPGAAIRYTLNGDRPTTTTGMEYTGPILVEGTTKLRVGAFLTGHLDSEIVTHTYLFPSDVLEQPNNPEGFPSIWEPVNGPSRDALYGVVPSIVNAHRDTLSDDLRSIPSLSLVMNTDDMFGPGCTPEQRSNPVCGAYQSGSTNIDQSTSVELIYPDGREGFQIDAGIRLQGGSSRISGVSKRNMRLRFTSDFGPTTLEFPLFEDSSVDTFDTLVLRANVQDGWNRSPVGRRQHIKDEFARRSQLAMGQPSARGTFMHLYINGLYWGVYNVTERPDAAFNASYLGGETEDWDTLNGQRLRTGNLDAWEELVSLTPKSGPDVRNFTEDVVAANYQAIEQLLDIDGYIDYVIVGMYMGTEDWLPNNHWAGRRSREGDQPVDPEDPSARFRFYHWDQELSLLGPDKFKNLPSFASVVGRILQLLRKSPDYVDRQAQRLYTHFFNGGALSPEVATARYQGMVDEIGDAMKGESIRWGNSPDSVSEWQAHAKFIIDDVIQTRREGVLALYRRFRMYPETDAPVLSQQGGPISAEPITITATTGDIYYTLDGSDPRMADGAISPTALKYVGPIILTDNVVLRTRAFGTDWSVYNEAEFHVDGLAQVVGDSNGDGRFDQLDVEMVRATDKYMTGQAASFEEGDWNGDGLFNQLDIVAVLIEGSYLTANQLATNRQVSPTKGHHQADQDEFVGKLDRLPMEIREYQ